MTERINPDGLVLSQDYAATMEEDVLPWLRARMQKLSVPGQGGKAIAAWRFDAEQPRGTVVLVHGFTESGMKFSELIHSLLRNGYSALTCDQRGHGQSWRDSDIQDLSLTHVDHFSDYVDDLRQLCQRVLADMPKPWLLFAHSMGGAVSALYLEKWHDTFSAAVLSSPMIAPNTGGMPIWVTKAMCHCAAFLGWKKRRVFVSKPFDGPEDFATGCATGRQRFDWYDRLRVATPTLQNNGPTYGWTLEASRVTGAILAPGAVERISCPVALYAAEEDGSVMPEPQKAFIERVKQGSYALVHGSRHEIYRSNDEVLFPWWHQVLGFFAQNR